MDREAIQTAIRSHLERRYAESTARFTSESSRDQAERSKQAEFFKFPDLIESGVEALRGSTPATHIAKGTFPDGKVYEVTSLLVNEPRRLDEVSSGSPLSISVDTTGNATENRKVHELRKLLFIKLGGSRLIDLLRESYEPAVTALHADQGKSRELSRCLLDIDALRTQGLRSDRMQKQLYWCAGRDATDDTQYHLLQPMFPSSLAHAIHADIQESRFGEHNKAIRDARRNGKPHEDTESDYRGLGVRKLGGTKPQNISQLNSERGGINYLLASLPPRWKQDRPRQFLHVSSAIPRIRFAEGMRELLDAYVAHIKSYEQRRMEEDDRRRSLETRLGIMLAIYGVTTAQLFEPGWTRAPECELALCEKLWLDPGRLDLPLRDVDADPAGHADDLEFQREFEKRDWPDQIAERFAKWLDEWLRKHDVPVGDVELRHFARQAVIDSVDWPNPMRRDLPSKRSWAREQP